MVGKNYKNYKDYKNGRIYKITSLHTDKIYIGMTAYSIIETRFYQHGTAYCFYISNISNNYCSSYELFKLGDCKIELIEEYPCNSYDELHKRENFWINKYKDICINLKTGIYSPDGDITILKKHKSEYNLMYYNKKKEADPLFFKKYYIKNKDNINRYYSNNKDVINKKKVMSRRYNVYTKVCSYFNCNYTSIKTFKCSIDNFCYVRV